MKLNERQLDAAATTVVVLVIVAILVALVAGWRNCRADGGQYVRGLLWMECVRR